MLLSLLLSDLLVSDSWATAALLIALLFMGGICLGLFYLGSKLEQSGWRSVKAIGTGLRVVALGLAVFVSIIAFKSLLSFVMGLVITSVIHLPSLTLS